MYPKIIFSNFYINEIFLKIWKSLYGINFLEFFMNSRVNHFVRISYSSYKYYLNILVSENFVYIS